MDSRESMHIGILEGLLEVAVEIGNGKRAREICETFFDFYSGQVAELDLLRGRSIGFEVIDHVSQRSPYDLLREEYALKATFFHPDSEDCQEIIRIARSNYGVEGDDMSNGRVTEYDGIFYGDAWRYN